MRAAAPPDLLLAADDHLTDLLREVKLIARSEVPAPGPSRLLPRLEALLGGRDDVRASLRDQATTALVLGSEQVAVELELQPLPVSTEECLALIDEIDELSQAAGLLTPPPPSDVRELRRAWLAAVVRQLPRATDEGAAVVAAGADRPDGARPEAWPTPALEPGPGAAVVGQWLAPQLSAAAIARRLLRSTLDSWGIGGMADLAALPLSELVTNAALHARTALQLVLVLDAGVFRVEVHDGSAAQAVAASHDAESATGRGLELVEALVHRWGVAYFESGKAVWFELDRSAAQTG